MNGRGSPAKKRVAVAREAVAMPATKLGERAADSGDDFCTGYDILVVNGEVDSALYAAVLDCVANSRKHDRVVVSVTTYGGSANEAYRIGRYLQTTYDEVVMLVPSLCKSAGTLLVIAAHKLLISPFGEIGPLDVQLRQRDELFERRSGLTTRAALADLQNHAFQLFEEYMLGIKARSGGSVSFRLAAEISGHVAAELMSGVYSQINPEALGQDYRDLAVATEYGERLAKFGGNLRPGSIRRLVHDYPSHDFVIDQYEAADLFLNVDLPSRALIELMKDHMADMMSPKRTQKVVKMLTRAKDNVVEDGANHEKEFEVEEAGAGESKANGQGHPQEHA